MNMKSAFTGSAFISEEAFDQASFAVFVASLPPDDLSKYELIHGRIIMNPPSGWPYGEYELGIGALLYHHVRRQGLGKAFGPSQGYELPTGETVAPDASVILKDRLERGPPPISGKFLRIVPNLAVEVISPTSENRDRVVKKQIYADAGIDEYWLVDVRTRTVTVLHLLPDGVYDTGDIFRTGEKLRSRVLPDLDVGVDECFPDLPT
jgi:Uma2 family endonuclease